MGGLASAQDRNGTVSNKKRPFNEGKRHFKKNKRHKVEQDAFDGSNEQVLVRNVQTLLADLDLQEDDLSKDLSALPDPFTEVEVSIDRLSSTGDGLGLIDGRRHVAVVPFTVPGDRVVAKIIRHDQYNSLSVADFVKVLAPASQRSDSGVKCQYFTRCSGCQFQMMDHKDQLEHKRTVVRNAYHDFSSLAPKSLPSVGATLSSRFTYGYRTKLTPHFDAPPNARRDRRQGNKPHWEAVPSIGFMLKGTRKTMDIEDCPIGTEAVRKGLARERKRVVNELDKYSRGATLLCREHTVIKPVVGRSTGNGDVPDESQDTSLLSDIQFPDDAVVVDTGQSTQIKMCTTDQNAITTEYVGPYRFDNPAGAFFQNNNSILPLFISFIRYHILASPATPFSPSISTDPAELSTSPTIDNPDSITHLVDAYSGSGLFTITLAPLFTKSIGIDVSEKSIQFATRNARLNDLTLERASFIAGDAAKIFEHVKDFPADKTAVVLDPSRKGCDQSFLRQLLDFAPKRICYVSCNVHTQARDVGVLCDPEKGGKYVVETLQGFDFFPQTAHVESVAILRRREESG